MILVTWNCCRGPYLRKAALLDSFNADIAVLQECARPSQETQTCLWFGENPNQGISVLYRELLCTGPSVVIGDFNSSTFWDKTHRADRNHSALVRLLHELGLVSAYHAHFNEEQGAEKQPTYYFHWNEQKPFHIDYCFIPKTWVKLLRRVEVAEFEAWKTHSDHRR